MDEESTFQRIVNRDATVDAQLAEQNAALNGERGGLLQVVSATDGSMLAVYKVDYCQPGMAWPRPMVGYT